MTTLPKLLAHAIHENRLSLTGSQQDTLIRYLELLIEWNRIFNLTTITRPREMVYLHLIDSLLVHPFLQGSRLLDIGTGAGLPGVPLAILNPHQHWTLLDKNGKKTRFLMQLKAELALQNIDIIHSRSEDFHHTVGFDSILSRAYGTLILFAESTCHLLAKDGVWIAMKGKYPHDELAALPPSLHVCEITPLVMNGMTIERHLVKMKRV